MLYYILMVIKLRFKIVINFTNYQMRRKGPKPIVCRFLDIELEAQIGEGFLSLQFFN